MGETKGNGEKSKLIYYLLSLLLTICGWFGSNIWARVNENDRRITILEANYGNINEGLKEIKSLIRKKRHIDD